MRAQFLFFKLHEKKKSTIVIVPTFQKFTIHPQSCVDFFFLRLTINRTPVLNTYEMLKRKTINLWNQYQSIRNGILFVGVFIRFLSLVVAASSMQSS